MSAGVAWPFPRQVALLFLALNEWGVEYVVVGSQAAVLHGAPMPMPTPPEADVVVAMDDPNLRRLNDALGALHARRCVRGVEVPGERVDAVAAKRAGGRFLASWRTDLGDLDVMTGTDGGSSYTDLAARAVGYRVLGGLVSVRAAALADVIRSKEVGNRPKDQAHLRLLRALSPEDLARHAQLLEEDA